MTVTHVTAPKARIDVSLDGVTFTRSTSGALRRGVPQRVQLSWDEVAGAEIHRTGKGRRVIRVRVVGAADVAHHRDDPYAIKVPKATSAAALDLVDQINAEVATRRRWREAGRA